MSPPFRAQDEAERRPMDSDLLSHATLGLLQHVAEVWLDHADGVGRDRLRAFVDGLISFWIRPLDGFT